MNKTEFLVRLQQGLTGLPQEDIDERLNFYNEMISDRMEDGLGEEEAVACVGDRNDVFAPGRLFSLHSALRSGSRF